MDRMPKPSHLAYSSIYARRCRVSPQAAHFVSLPARHTHAAMAYVANGDTAAIKALYSHRGDPTSIYGWGGYEKSWAAGRERQAEAAGDLRPGQALPAQPLDRGGDVEGQLAGRPGGRRAAVVEGRRAARHRASHLPTVRSLIPNSAATRLAGCFSSSTRRTISRRLCGVVRAFLWMFIRGSGLLADGGRPPVSQPRSG